MPRFLPALLLSIAAGALACAVWTLPGRRLDAAPLVVVCEAGAFEPVTDPTDPYRKAEAACHVGTSAGRPVTVAIID